MRRSTGPVMFLAAAVVILATAASSAATAAVAGETPMSLRATTSAPPSASAFAKILVGSARQAAARGDVSSEIVRPQCVEPSPGYYMCAYTIVRHGAATCHLMQGRWTPDRASTITVTLAGRTGRCATLEQAIRSLP